MNAAKFDVALQSYLAKLASHTGQEAYSEVEFPKLAIADCLLESLGLPTRWEPPCKAAPIPKRIRLGFVYLLKNLRNGFYKIGWSIQPGFREKTLQAEEPEVCLEEFWLAGRAAETVLHLQFRAKRLRGEWFNLTAEDLTQLRAFFTP